MSVQALENPTVLIPRRFALLSLTITLSNADNSANPTNSHPQPVPYAEVVEDNGDVNLCVGESDGM